MRNFGIARCDSRTCDSTGRLLCGNCHLHGRGWNLGWRNEGRITIIGRRCIHGCRLGRRHNDGGLTGWAIQRRRSVTATGCCTSWDRGGSGGEEAVSHWRGNWTPTSGERNVAKTIVVIFIGRITLRGSRCRQTYKAVPCKCSYHSSSTVNEPVFKSAEIKPDTQIEEGKVRSPITKVLQCTTQTKAEIKNMILKKKNTQNSSWRVKLAWGEANLKKRTIVEK